tara:strand:- start:256 stop:699 length:444 start_codon:yes stop_codon:yes gene_type:complete
MKKKIKLNAVAWLSNVIFLLQRGDLHIDEVFEMTNTPPNEMCESLIYEHPSIHVINNRVSFKRFADVNNQEELLALLRDTRPAGIRRIDLRGIYPFVDADLDELIFHEKIVFLDNKQDALTVPSQLSSLPAEIKTLFLNAMIRGHGV